MTAPRLPRHRTGDPELDQRLLALLDGRAANDEDRDLLFEMLSTILRMAGDHPDRLNLKITNAALREMRQAFKVFAPFHTVPKITIFGSARTQPDDPLYQQARDAAHALAQAGWMVVTGAGPGIMAAGAEGAGRDQSIGVNIRLPFEQDANPFIASDPKLVSMKYFFTRKLMLMKESAGFVVLPGGFGTLDETFELLTLMQTGKAAPAPLVLLEVPGGTYWKAFDHLVRDELAARGLVSEDDLALCRITSDVDEAVAEVLGFYRNYHSMRYVGADLILRLRAAPTDGELAQLNRDFADLCVGEGAEGWIERTTARPPEVAGDDNVDLPRLALRFDRMSHGRLRQLIDALNRLPSAPPLALPDPAATAAAATPPDTGGGQDGAAPDPVVAGLLARAGGSDEAVALEAAAGLEAALDRYARGPVDRLTEARQRAVIDEITPLVLDAETPAVGVALLNVLAAAPPLVGLDHALDLLVNHHRALDGAEVAALLRGLDRMLAAAESGPDRRQVAMALRANDPRPALRQVGDSNVTARVDRLAGSR